MIRCVRRLSVLRLSPIWEGMPHDDCDRDRAFADALHPSQSSALGSPQGFAEILDIDLETLAKLAGVDSNTVISNPNSESFQHYMRDAVRVISVAAGVAGGQLDRCAVLVPRRATFYIRL